MVRKKRFSLIEIAVAMAVAAVGVAGIMALLPISVKSSSDSVGDTLAADAANTVIAQLDRAAWENFEWIQTLRTSKPTYFNDTDLKKLSEDNTLPVKLKMGSESYKIDEPNHDNSGLQNGHFAFFFGPPNEPADFAAEVICWRELDSALRLTSMNAKTGRTTTIPVASIKHPTTGKQPYVRIFVEISWPITKPYKKGSGATASFPRQSRIFVREYLDPTYYKPVN